MKKILKIISEFVKARWMRKWKTRAELEKYQDKEMKKHLEYMKNNSPYFKENKIEDEFHMDKKFMMEIFDILNKNYNLRVFLDDGPYRVLIRTILSQRTRDENTDQATDNLFNKYKDIYVFY